MDAEIRRKIGQTKFAMMEDEGLVFFSSLLSFLKIQIDDTMDTAWTDAVNLGLNPELVMRATPEELMGVFMHELGHVIYDHIPIAMENKDWIDHKLHNIAGDHHINLVNSKAGYILPHWIKPYQDPKYTDMSTMAIYADLEQNPPEDLPNGMGEDLRMPEDMDAAEHKERVISIVVKATIQAKMSNGAGSVPGFVQRFVDEVTCPKLPWWMILQNKMASMSREDYSMRRPNRRYMPDMYLPSLYSESMGHMIEAFDVSGSITKDELNVAVSEGKYAWETVKPESLRFMTFDVAIHHNEMYVEGDTLPTRVELEGGGGTCVDLILKYIREEDPKLALIFTDGGFAMPDLEDIETDIIWIIKGCPTFNPPSGTVIHMEDHS